MAEINGFKAVDLKNEETLITLIRMSEVTERYEDMRTYVKLLIELKCNKGIDLNTEERSLFTVCYKNIVGNKRVSWRSLNHNCQQQPQQQEEIQNENNEWLKKYQSQITLEINVVCNEVIQLLENHLLKLNENKNNENEIFYLKMAGDYYRYMSETNLINNDNSNLSLNYYEKAMNKAKQYLKETNPTRLGLALNYSVMLYEIVKQPLKACQLAEETFNQAIEKLDTLDNLDYKDATLIMQLIRDNLTLWREENENMD